MLPSIFQLNISILTFINSVTENGSTSTASDFPRFPVAQPNGTALNVESNSTKAHRVPPDTAPVGDESAAKSMGHDTRLYEIAILFLGNLNLASSRLLDQSRMVELRTDGWSALGVCLSIITISVLFSGSLVFASSTFHISSGVSSSGPRISCPSFYLIHTSELS